MYTPNQIVSGIRNPRKAILEMNRIYHRKIRGQTGIKVMEEDWDNLIILDACRYDLFKQTNTINGKLSSVISTDSSTSGFLKANFSDEHHPDTVYVSANPQVQRHGIDNNFHKCIRLWEDHWDGDLGTVLPKDVTKRVLQVYDQYPNKRIIVHYIQPHYPFIGETGRKIEQGSVTGDGIIKGEKSRSSIWDQLEEGSIDEDVVRTAYKENLELVLPEIKRLLENSKGKTIVTSDHGNSFGRLGVYGHPGGTYLSDLIKVPWLVIENSSRKKIKEGSINSSDIDTDVSKQLSDLGYVNYS